MSREDFSFRPDFKDAGVSKDESKDAVWTWLSPPEPDMERYRYAVIKEDGDLLQIQPDEGRFKKGLAAWRFSSEEGSKHSVWMVTKVRPNRIDLQRSKK